MSKSLLPVLRSVLSLVVAGALGAAVVGCEPEFQDPGKRGRVVLLSSSGQSVKTTPFAVGLTTTLRYRINVSNIDGGKLKIEAEDPTLFEIQQGDYSPRIKALRAGTTDLVFSVNGSELDRFTVFSEAVSSISLYVDGDGVNQVLKGSTLKLPSAKPERAGGGSFYGEALSGLAITTEGELFVDDAQTEFTTNGDGKLIFSSGDAKAELGIFAVGIDQITNLMFQVDPSPVVDRDSHQTTYFFSISGQTESGVVAGVSCDFGAVHPTLLWDNWTNKNYSLVLPTGQTQQVDCKLGDKVVTQVLGVKPL